MRTIFLMILCVLGMQVNAQQSIKSATFIVKGNCEECKSRIENAADIKGVKLLKWDEKTKVASVTYNADKVSLLQIQEAIAASGHQAGEQPANKTAYKKLPKCCQYEHGKCEDPKGK
jgi:hypothetical protein